MRLSCLLNPFPALSVARALGACALAVTLALSSPSLAKPGDEANKASAVPSADALESLPPESQPPENQPPKNNAPASPRASTDLPWVKKRKTEPLAVVRPPGSVREILEKFDIGDSQLEGFFNGQPLSVAEEEVIVRILFRLPRIGLENIQKWRKPDVQLEQLVAAASDHRLEVIPLQGRLISVEQREVSPELAVRLEIKNFYLARIELEGAGYEALVAVRRVPDYWIDNEELDEPVTLDGIFLKAGEIVEDKPQLVFVSRRVRWQPDQPIPELNIGPAQLRLAELGLDLSLLEDLKQSNRREIGDLDREPQYQLLDLAGRVPESKLVAHPPKELDVVELLKEPEKHQGELMSVYGLARRITKVIVDDPDIRARFGIDHYYEISMTVNLGDKTIRFVDDVRKKEPEEEKQAENEGPGTEDKEQNQEEPRPDQPAAEQPKAELPKGPVFNNDYPVTVCVRELPDDLQPADSMRDLVQVNGIFMKTWAYRNNKMAQFENKLQVAPLLIGKTAHRVVPERVYSWVSDALVGFALAAAALIIASVFWWFRTNEVEKKKLLSDLEGGGKQPSFAGLENAPIKPDFSGLEKAESDPPPESPPRS